MKAIIFALAWCACGLLAAGIVNKSSHDDYHWSTLAKCEDMHAKDHSFYIMWGIISGPIGVGWALAFSGFAHKGWTLAKQPCEGY